MDPNDLASISVTSNQAFNLKRTLQNNAIAIKKQVKEEKKSKIKKDIASFQTGRNTIVEGENPVHILGIPNEIWEQVFDRLDDTTDIQSCYNTCQQFRSSCSSKQRTLIQLKRILPILMERGELTHNEILNLRLISKPINKCVDHFLQSRRLSWTSSSAPIVYHLMPVLYTAFQTKYMHATKGNSIIQHQFLRHPKTRNPLISRYVQIHDRLATGIDRFRWEAQVTEFLKRWGKQIWYLVLKLNCSKKWFLRILKLMPNLKYLKLIGTITDEGGCERNDYCKHLQEACPQLVCLVFPENLEDIAAVSDHLIAAFSNKLTQFETKTWKSLFSKFNWSKLKNLATDSVVLSDLCDLRADNLVEIKMDFCGDDDFDMLLRMINHFPNLKGLHINFGSKSEVSELEVIKKILDNNVNTGCCKVEFLRFQMPNCDKISMSILAWFPMVRYLKIEIDKTEDAEKLGENGIHKQNNVELLRVVDFNVRILEQSLEKSNMWFMLPFLKLLMVANLSDDTLSLFKRRYIRNT